MMIGGMHTIGAWERESAVGWCFCFAWLTWLVLALYIKEGIQAVSTKCRKLAVFQLIIAGFRPAALVVALHDT